MRIATSSVLVGSACLSPLPADCSRHHCQAGYQRTGGVRRRRCDGDDRRTARDLHHGGQRQGRVAKAEKGRQTPGFEGRRLCLADQARSIRGRLC